MFANVVNFDNHPLMEEYLQADKAIPDGATVLKLWQIGLPDNTYLERLSKAVSDKRMRLDFEKLIRKAFKVRPFEISAAGLTKQIEKLSADIDKFVRLGGFYNLSQGVARFPVSYPISKDKYFQLLFIFGERGFTDTGESDVPLLDNLVSMNRSRITYPQVTELINNNLLS